MAMIDGARDNLYLGSGYNGSSGAGVWGVAGIIGGAVLASLWARNHGHGCGGGFSGFTPAACAPASESSVTAGRLESSQTFGTVLSSIVENARNTVSGVVTDAAMRAEAVNNVLAKLGDGQVALAGGLRELACQFNNGNLQLADVVKAGVTGLAADLGQRFNCLNEKLTGTFNTENCKLDKIIELLTAAPAVISTNATMARQAELIDALKAQINILSNGNTTPLKSA